jgi:hypothetical protein
MDPPAQAVGVDGPAVFDASPFRILPEFIPITYKDRQLLA